VRIITASGQGARFNPARAAPIASLSAALWHNAGKIQPCHRSICAAVALLALLLPVRAFIRPVITFTFIQDMHP
jgi:hypothetical protein